MKNVLYSLLILALGLPMNLIAQDKQENTGFAGDHFSLEGALELFKQSESPEEFEKRLNMEENYVNNLDLNEDGQTDYIKVVDNMDGHIHAIALQVDVNKDETQDIAVILIEKTGEESAVLQIVGDEDVYGEEIIVEPYSAPVESGGKGMAEENFGSVRLVVNVWAWPGVRFIYRPSYKVYRSPYRWKVYPGWWKPWKPHPWNWHYSKRKVYHLHYKPIHTHRVIKAHSFYKPKRSSSVTVKTRTVHTRTVVKKGDKGVKVSKSTTVKKSSRIETKNRNAKMQSKRTSKKTKSTVKGKKGAKVTTTWSNTKKVRK